MTVEIGGSQILDAATLTGDETITVRQAGSTRKVTAKTLIPSLNVTRNGVVGDAVFDTNTQTWSGTDNTVALQALIDAAPVDGTIDFDGGDYMTQGLTVNKSLTLRNGRIIAHASTTGYLLTLTDTSTLGRDFGNHTNGTNLDHFRLDGNARSVDCGGIDCVRLQHFEWNHVESFGFQREAVRWHDSNRECDVNFLHVRYSGDSARGYPAVDIQNRSTRDGHNNVVFSHFKSVYNMGVPLRIGSDGQANATRALSFIGGMIHGAEADTGTENPPASGLYEVQGPDGTVYSTTDMQNLVQIEIINGRDISFYGIRLRAPGTAPLVRVYDNLPGDAAPASPLSSFKMYACPMDAENSTTGPIHLDGTVSSVGFFGNTMSVGTRPEYDWLEGVVQDDSVGTNDDRVASFGNSWDHEQKFQTFANAASYGQSTLTLSRDKARTLWRVTATDLVVTIPLDVGDATDIPIGESFALMFNAASGSLTINPAGGVSFEVTGSSMSTTTRYEVLHVTKTGADRWTGYKVGS